MSKIVKRFPILGSSQDPDKLSLTIQGLAIYIIPIVIVLAKNAGVELAENDLTGLINSISLLFATAITAIGFIRKIVTDFKKR